MHTLITAGGSTIARQLVRRLTAEGHACTVAGRNAEKLQALYADNPGVVCLEADLLNSADVEQLFAKAAERNGHVTAFAHCLGSILIAPLHRTSDEQWMQTLNLNLNSAVFGLRAFIRHCKGQTPSASAVLISSCAAGIGLQSHEAVAAAKAGIEGLVRSAAATYAADGIRVNAVAPGLTRTAMAEPFLKSEALQQAAARQYPLAGLNEADDVAAAMQFLLGPSSARITGTVMPVDGGFVSVRPLVK